MWVAFLFRGLVGIFFLGIWLDFWFGEKERKVDVEGSDWEGGGGGRCAIWEME